MSCFEANICSKFKHDILTKLYNMSDISMVLFVVQIEQELDLVLKKPGLYRSFSTDWKQTWVPAVLEYCQRLKRKDVAALLKNFSSCESPGKMNCCIFTSFGVLFMLPHLYI